MEGERGGGEWGTREKERDEQEGLERQQEENKGVFYFEQKTAYEITT